MADSAAIPSKKRDIIEMAYRHFYEGGFHATGIDTVMADSGISKRTLYKYFPSKEDLIEAVLDQYGDNVEARLFEPALVRSDDPRGQIEALFDVRREMMETCDHQGCLAMKAAQEYMGKHAGIESRGKISGLYVESRIADLCEKAGFPEPKDVAAQISVILQGAVLLSQVRRDTMAFDAAKKTLKTLLYG